MGNAFSLPPSSLVAGAEWLSLCLYRHVVNAGKEWVLLGTVMTQRETILFGVDRASQRLLALEIWNIPTFRVD